MITIKEVFPANTQAELPPHQITFIKHTKQAKTDFEALLEEEKGKINGIQIQISGFAGHTE